MGHWQGTSYLDHPTGGMYITPSGFGTDTLEITFSLEEVGNPDSLKIVEVETHDWIDAEGEGAYYYDTAGPEATEPDVEDEIDPEGVIDEFFARGMMCIAVAIILPIIIIVIIIVVVFKLLSGEDEEGQEPSQQRPPQQQPPPQQQQQPPSPPGDQGGSEQAPPPPGKE